MSVLRGWVLEGAGVCGWVLEGASVCVGVLEGERVGGFYRE